MTADEARKIVDQKEKENVDSLFNDYVIKLDAGIKLAADRREYSIGIDWAGINTDVAKLLIKHYESKGFRVCCADDASYIGWHK